MNLLLAAVLGFSFPSDQAGKLAEARLQPRGDVGDLSWGVGNGPRVYVRPAFLLPDVPLSRFADAAPRAVLAAAPPKVQPVMLAEGTPLGEFRVAPSRPEDLQFAAGPLIRLQRVDVEATIPLPTIARPKVERASLADPTADASIQAALTQPIPVRVNPEPFVPVNLPRPFEHRETVRMQQTPPEDPTPATSTPRRPG